MHEPETVMVGELNYFRLIHIAKLVPTAGN